MRRDLILVLALMLCTGCGDDAPSDEIGPRASGGTTTPAADTDSGARATGGVFESPATQPAPR